MADRTSEKSNGTPLDGYSETWGEGRKKKTMPENYVASIPWVGAGWAAEARDPTPTQPHTFHVHPLCRPSCTPPPRSPSVTTL